MPLVGAAIGIGIAAISAERGGADFILVLNAGRLRAMGGPSLACMFPITDSNDLTFEVGTREILSRVSVPVFFGLCTFDPRLHLATFLAKVRSVGFAGVANFPTAIHLTGEFREAVERAGVGFAREVETLRIARQNGLLTFGYAKTRAEALLLAEAKPDIFCLNFGWNAGGTRGLSQSLTLEAVAEIARSIIQKFRRLSPHSACLVEGGPIVTADDMYEIYLEANADGYVGGSTIDRLPFESSVTESASSFKNVSHLKHALEFRSSRLIALGRSIGLVGQSPSLLGVLERARALARTNSHILVVGQRGSGKTTLARAIHGWSGRGGSLYVFDAAMRSSDILIELLGGKPDNTSKRRLGALEMSGATILIENIEWLPSTVLALLHEAFAIGFIPDAEGEPRHISARVVATAHESRRTGETATVLDQLFSETKIRMPALRERLEDLAPIARFILETVAPQGKSASCQISPSGYRFLFAHDWPGNVRELRLVLDEALARTKGSRLQYEHFAATPGSAGGSKQLTTDEEERAAILAALKRNRYRKGETAQALGISRRTLFNKMRRYGLAG